MPCGSGPDDLEFEAGEDVRVPLDHRLAPLVGLLDPSAELLVHVLPEEGAHEAFGVAAVLRVPLLAPAPLEVAPGQLDRRNTC